MQTIWQDLRYGARVLRKQPGFTFIAVFTLALGIGVNTAIFSAVSSLLLRPSQYASPEKLAIVFTGGKQRPSVYDDFSYLNYLDYRDRNQSFSGLIAYRMTSAAISNTSGGSDDRAEVVWGETVSGNYFDVLGVPPALGRGFRPEEDRTPSTHAVVVIGHGLWRRRFNADPAIVGRSVYLNGHPFTVIGVAPERFIGTKFPLGMEFWVPLMMRSQLMGSDEWRTDRANNPFGLMGRLKPGVTIAQADADLSLIARELEKSYPQANEGTKVQVVTERQGRVSDAFPVMRLSSLMALAVVGLVLLIACANVANLLLVRGEDRQKEIAVRAALGASRGRIVRQLLMESSLLAALGGGLGLLLAVWGVDALLKISPADIPRLAETSLDLRVTGFALLISLLTAALFGLAPALRAVKFDLHTTLKEGGRSGAANSRSRLRRSLVVLETALAVVLLVAAGLLIRSMRELQRADVGFRSDHLLTMRLTPPSSAYPDNQRVTGLYERLLVRAGALPGVESAAVTNPLPLNRGGNTTVIEIEGRKIDMNRVTHLSTDFHTVSIGYFQTMGMRLLRGRLFTSADQEGATPVAIINESFARNHWPGEDPVGKRFRYLDNIPERAKTRYLRAST